MHKKHFDRQRRYEDAKFGCVPCAPGAQPRADQKGCQSCGAAATMRRAALYSAEGRACVVCPAGPPPAPNPPLRPGLC